MDSVREVLAKAVMELHNKLSRGLDDDAVQLIITALQSANIELIQWRTDWENAPKGGADCLVRFRADLSSFTERNDLGRYEGRSFVMRHPGLAEDGFDMGWGFPGVGGFPDDWLDAFAILPSGGE